jgi:hypothetical protein
VRVIKIIDSLLIKVIDGMLSTRLALRVTAVLSPRPSVEPGGSPSSAPARREGLGTTTLGRSVSSGHHAVDFLTFGYTP